MVTSICFPVKLTEIDSLGIAHHSHYPIWFEVGRGNFFKKAGISKHKMSDQGLFLPLLKMKCEYKSPARYGDKILLTTSLTCISCVKAKFEYKILNKSNGKVLATGNTVHAWTNKKLEPLNMEKAAPEIYMKLKQLVESAVQIEDIP
jgi:acyl-CoA thioester hydrolase